MRKLRILIKFADGSPLRSIKEPAQILRHEVCADRKNRFENAEINALKERDQNPASPHGSTLSFPIPPIEQRENGTLIETQRRDPPIDYRDRLYVIS
jgi:hypothetical protein